jgi:hypothetical protein
MALSQEIVDNIISKNNLNANEKIYDALYGKAADQIAMRKVEVAQRIFNQNSDPFATEVDSATTETVYADETEDESEEQPT